MTTLKYPNIVRSSMSYELYTVYISTLDTKIDENVVDLDLD